MGCILISQSFHGEFNDMGPTSWKEMSVDFTARKASNPGRKLKKIAAKGVWPLFVRPSVRLITSYSLRCASTNNVRLDTYSAEFLLDLILKGSQNRWVNSRSR